MKNLASTVSITIPSNRAHDKTFSFFETTGQAVNKTRLHINTTHFRTIRPQVDITPSITTGQATTARLQTSTTHFRAIRLQVDVEGKFNMLVRTIKTN